MKPIYFLLFCLISYSGFTQSYFQETPEYLPIANRGMLTGITATISYQGYDESQAYFGQGEYEIFADNVNGILDKPIIVLDGFDPGDSRDITGLYNSLGFGGQNIADILRDEGFDIVILNAPQYTTNGKAIDGGADYIQRNAMVLVEMINFINANKVGNEELVVLGPSMGGLIGRYALSYMEQNSLDPETRLYISFDSPHRGANIPVSLQYLINYLADQIGDADAQAIVDNVLNSPAAKEMLFDHLLGHLLAGSTYEQDPSQLLPIGAPGFRDAFQSELNALGFPLQVRNVSMINGSGNATTTGIPNAQVIDTTLDLGAGITADVNLHFTPEAGLSNNVTDFQSFFVGVPVGSFSADAESFGYTDGIDSSPGGISSISSALGDGGGNPIILAFIAALEQDDYSFIPTISSLAIDNEDDWYAVPDIGGTHNSPFVNTFIPSENEEHVKVTQANAQFALDEIRNGVLGVQNNNLDNKYLLAQNPVSEEIRIRLNASYNYNQTELVVYNVAGQQLLSEVIENPIGEITLPISLSSGVYMIQLSDSATTQNIKFVVE
ncbi:alpha/beta fold hydrolase [Ulvibacter antarcticus]|uniref:Putative secreted protein (Por secretion system target) n=1 Tax=Ulvibacter antarcticus TaxID=442714 RepID=A0A3L9YDW7_9FLAO|nr:alpha/beta fold hydrolase [Ulvibacter antarcticus]RMA58896.1 putative secreted protein (Por secretion system target) [Ulvibacter antarcticus]